MINVGVADYKGREVSFDTRRCETIQCFSAQPKFDGLTLKCPTEIEVLECRFKKDGIALKAKYNK